MSTEVDRADGQKGPVQLNRVPCRCFLRGSYRSAAVSGNEIGRDCARSVILSSLNCSVSVPICLANVNHLCTYQALRGRASLRAAHRRDGCLVADQLPARDRLRELGLP